jgi:L-threonylcarbamoyladenylate synthase
LNPLVAKNGKVGIRVPDHPLVLKLTERFGPITTTSANTHGGREPTDISMALNDLGEGVKIYIDCGKCRSNTPSTVIDISDKGIEVLREGAIPREALHG